MKIKVNYLLIPVLTFGFLFQLLSFRLHADTTFEDNIIVGTNLTVRGNTTLSNATVRGTLTVSNSVTFVTNVTISPQGDVGMGSYTNQ